MEGLELISFQVISLSGSAKSKCFEAMKYARNNEMDKAEACIQEANTLFIKAHKFHSELIQKESAGENVAVNLLLVHAEDQLMSSELSKDMAIEFINLYKKVL